MTRLSTTLARLPCPSCWMNASGACSGRRAVVSLSNGEDRHRALSPSAKGVQIGSSLTKAGPAVFARVQQELTVAPGRRQVGA